MTDALQPAPEDPPPAPAVETPSSRRHAVWVGVAIIVLVGALWGRHLADWVGWQTVASEDFSDPTWSQRWIEPPSVRGLFAVQDGRLVSTSDSDALLIFRQRLTTPLVIEYSGQILPGATPCDLSVQWSEDSGLAEDPARFGRAGRSYMIQAGAFTNQFCAIYQNPGRRLLAHANRRLEVGRTYRFRVELDGVRMRMSIDGETVLEQEDDYPTRSGCLALYGYYKGKAFDDVRILQGRRSNCASETEAADIASVEGRWEAAAGLYARVAETAVDASLALYRKGLAEWRGGQAERAAKTWSKVAEPAFADRIACHRLEAALGGQAGTPHLTGFEELWRDRPSARPQLRLAWRNLLQRLVLAPQRDPLVVDYLLAVREKLFAQDESARYLAANALMEMGLLEEVIKRFPEERNLCISSMLRLGRSAEALALPDIAIDDRRHAHGMRGEFARVIELKGLGPPWRAWTLIRMGQAEQALREEVDAAYPVLLHLGRAAELLATTPLSGQAANDTLICLGRLEEAAGDGVPGLSGSGGSVIAMLMLGQVDLAERIGKAPRHAIRCMQAAETGDAVACTRLLQLLRMPAQSGGSYGWFPAMVVRPFIERLNGEADAFASQLRPRLDLLSGTFQRTPWYLARALLGDAPVDSVLEIPCASEAKAWHALITGVRAEITGDRAAARQGYEAFSALPMHQRLLVMNAPDPDVEWFVAWRLRALAK